MRYQTRPAMECCRIAAFEAKVKTSKNLQQKHVTSWSWSCQPTPHQTARAISQQAVKDAQKSRYSNALGTCPRRCDRALLAMRLRETTQSFIMLSTASQAFTSELTLALIFCCCTLAADLSSRSATKGPLAPPWAVCRIVLAGNVDVSGQWIRC